MPRRLAAAAGKDPGREQHEAAVLERVRQVLPPLLAAVVETATSGLAPRVRGQRSACPGCGRKVRPHQERPRQVLTQCGAVTIERGTDPARVKVVGNVAGAPPLRDVLRHRGWEVTRLDLPPLPSAGRTIVAPAEVEL